MKLWFSELDFIELYSMGYRMYEHEVLRIRRVNDIEVVFLKEDIVSTLEIDPRELWKSSIM